MVPKLILVRHGKACERSEALPDEMRRLTSAGRRACAARFAHMLPDLLKGTTLTIWTSPALRAMQTADEFSRALGDAPIEVVQQLYDASGPELLTLLTHASGNIAIVGHNPALSDMGACLDASCPPLGKGSVAAFSFEPDENGVVANARLEWLVAGPDHTRWKTIIQLERGFKHAAARIDACEAALSENPDDVEALHKYRISLRIARSLVAFAACYAKRSWAKKTQATLKKLQEPTSLVRELDILMGVVEPGSAQALLCAHKRAEVRIAFMHTLQEKPTRKTLRRAMRVLAHPQWRDATEASGISRAELAALLTEQQEAQQTRLETLDFTDREAVHSVRKQAKLLRYAAREFAMCLPEGAGEVSAQMQATQDRLGKLCDAWVNEELLVRICGENEGTAETLAALRAQASELVAELEAV